VINSLTNALKLERMKLQEQFDGDDSLSNDTILKDLLAMLELPLITEEMMQILTEYYRIELDDHGLENEKVLLDIGPINSQI